SAAVDAIPPLDLTLIILSATDGQLNWTPDPTNCGYQVHRHTAPYFNPTTSTRLSPPLTNSTNSYLLTGDISDGLNYFYYLEALACGGQDAFSQELGLFHYTITLGN
ncbi:MAG TPA: hypothetical protein VLL52_25035, partial [Anaerolineae bacterium]|nr:hypothetical protein [Anaerolineae bacterium]